MHTGSLCASCLRRKLTSKICPVNCPSADQVPATLTFLLSIPTTGPLHLWFLLPGSTLPPCLHHPTIRPSVHPYSGLSSILTPLESLSTLTLGHPIHLPSHTSFCDTVTCFVCFRVLFLSAVILFHPSCLSLPSRT